MSTQVIATLSDLKRALQTPGWIDTVQDQGAWLPRIVEAISWQTQLSKHFVLHFFEVTPEPTGTVFPNFLTRAEEIYHELQVFFEIAPQTKTENLIEEGRLTLFIIHTRSDRTFGGLTDPHLLFYLMDTQSDRSVMTRLRHELAHWVWGRRFGEAPRLWQEGVAVYAEQDSEPGGPGIRATALCKATPLIDAAPRIEELVVNDRFWQNDGAYTIAGSWIAFLVQQHGWGPLKQLFLHSDYEDQNSLGVFEAVYGTRLESAETLWRNALRSCG